MPLESAHWIQFTRQEQGSGPFSTRQGLLGQWPRPNRCCAAARSSTTKPWQILRSSRASQLVAGARTARWLQRCDWDDDLDEWAVAERRYLSEESMALIDQHLQEVATTEQPELPAA